MIKSFMITPFMIKPLRISAALLGLVATTIGAYAIAASAPSRPVESQTLVAKSTPRLLGGARAAPSTSINLGPLSDKEHLALRASSERSKYYQVGIGRSLSKAQRQIDLQNLAWITAADGTRYATLEFESSYAAALRLGIAKRLPKGVTLYVYGTYQPETVYGPYQVQDLRVDGQNSDTYWLPIIDGDVIRVELHAARDVSLDQLAITIPAISHLTQSVRQDGLKNLADLGRSGTCNIDIACTPPSSATWVGRGNSVAKYYVTTSSGDTGACTGTLVNVSSGAPTAYFLTANHCISTTAEAASMHFYWFFQRATCNGTNPTAPLTETVGATFINAVLANDATLVRLNTTPPAGTVYSGWTSTPITSGDTMMTLHHPSGDVKKYSDGRNQGFAAYESTTPNSTASHIRMVWDRGTTEGGSSGSGLFNANGELVGTLSGGSAACDRLTNPDWYGRFDQSYPTLQPWLTPGPGGPPPPQAPPVPPSIELTSAVPVSGAVRLHEDVWYRIQTAANTTGVTVVLTNLTADADIGVFRDTQTGTPACVSELLNTNNESCTLTITGAGTIYIDVYGYQAANYTITATLTAPAPAPPPFSGGGDSGGGGGSIGSLLLGLLSLLAMARRAAHRTPLPAQRNAHA